MTIKLSCGVFAGIAAIFCSIVESAAAEDKCQMQLLATTKVSIDNNGSVIVPAKFEGRDVWMRLAMNHGVPSLHHNVVQELGLAKRLKRNEWDANYLGKRIQHQVKAESLIFGGANFTGWDFMVLPDVSQPLETMNNQPVIGTLTSIFMNVVDLELNLATNELRLFKHKACKGPPQHWEGDVTSMSAFVDPTGLLLFSMELDGQKVEASLNTGSRRSVLSSQVSKRYFGFDESSPEIERESSGPGREVVSFYAMSLTAKGLNIKNTSVALRSGDKCEISRTSQGSGHIQRGRSSGSIGYSNCWSSTPFSIGTDLLKKLHVYLASKEGVVYIKSAQAANVTNVVLPADKPALATQSQ